MCRGLNANGALAGGESVPSANERGGGPATVETGAFTRHQAAPTIDCTPRGGEGGGGGGGAVPVQSLFFFFAMFQRQLCFFSRRRSGQNQVTMHKCFLLLVFMVIILPSLGLTRYSGCTLSQLSLLGLRDNSLLSSVCSLDLFFTWLFDVNFLDERNVKFQ